MRGVFESEGDIRTVDLLSALTALWREKAGGALRFSRPGATAGFDLVGGEVVATLSSQAQFDTAAILIRAGKLDPAAAGRLTMPEGGDATVAAMQAGLITDRDRRWGLKIRAIEVLSDLLGWLEGEYVRDPGASEAPGDWTLPLPRLVLELFLRSRDRTLVEHSLGASDLPLLKAVGFDEEFESFGLTADAGAVVGLIDGRASAEEIAESSNADEFAVLKLLAALTTLGLVHPAEAAPPADVRRPSEGVRESKREPVSPPVEALEKVETERWEIEEESAEALPAETEGEPPEAPAEEIAPAPFPLRIEEEARPLEAELAAGDRPAQPAFPPAAAPEPDVEKPASPRADLFSRPERGIEAVDPVVDLSGGGDPPPGPPGRRSPAVLLGLLAALVVAVAVLLVVRSRGNVTERTASVNLRPTAAETPEGMRFEPVFPPAETAVPLPKRGSRTPVPAFTASHAPPVTEKPTLTAAVPPTRVFTPVPPTLPAPTAVPTRPLPTRGPAVIPTRAAPTKPATPVPTRAAPTSPPTAAPTRPAPTRAPTGIPTRAAPPAPPPTAVASARGNLTLADWIARAERDKRDLSKRRDVRYAVQLELACELETLQKAWNWDKPAGTIWLLTTSFRGRTCFRVLWGRYASLAKAREARTRVPEFFAAPGNRPTVVSVR